RRVRAGKGTFRRAGPPPGGGETPSLSRLEVVVAAPLLDGDDHVIGYLYGERRQAAPSRVTGGGKVEAMLVDLLASGVSAGLARQKEEQARQQREMDLLKARLQ